MVNNAPIQPGFFHLPEHHYRLWIVTGVLLATLINLLLLLWDGWQGRPREELHLLALTSFGVTDLCPGEVLEHQIVIELGRPYEVVLLTTIQREHQNGQENDLHIYNISVENFLLPSGRFIFTRQTLLPIALRDPPSGETLNWNLSDSYTWRVTVRSEADSDVAESRSLVFHLRPDCY